MAALIEPSKPQNAYWIWLSENREALTKEAGSAKGSVVGKLAGEKWKTLSESAKQPSVKKATEARAAYELAMEEFKAAGGESGKRRQEKKDAKDAKEAKHDKKAKKKAKQNSGAPKRPPSAYWLWQVENRELLIKEAGTNKIPVLGKLAGEKWSKLPAAQKEPFEKRAEEAKAKYTKDVAEWKASNADAGKDADNDDEGDNEESEESPSKKARKTEPAKAASTKTEPVTKKATPKAKGKAKDNSQKSDEIDPTVLKTAQGLGFESQLKNLVSRAELKGTSADAMLKALQNCDGLVNKAKNALLAGA